MYGIIFAYPAVCLLAQRRSFAHCSLYISWPSRDRASNIFLHAVAMSEIDCHSSSDESVVSERTKAQLNPSIYVSITQT